jgi:hypothetical protein
MPALTEFVAVCYARCPATTESLQPASHHDLACIAETQHFHLPERCNGNGGCYACFNES